MNWEQIKAPIKPGDFYFWNFSTVGTTIRRVDESQMPDDSAWVLDYIPYNVDKQAPFLSDLPCDAAAGGGIDRLVHSYV